MFHTPIPGPAAAGLSAVTGQVATKNKSRRPLISVSSPTFLRQTRALFHAIENTAGKTHAVCFQGFTRGVNPCDIQNKIFICG